MTDKTGELTKALAAVSSAIGPLETDARNEQQKYNYISADKILERVGRELPKHGLSIIPSVVDDSYETVEYKQGGTRIDGRVRFVMHITHESGERLNAPWTGYGSDYVVPDKAIYKAITSGHKYFLMKLFNIGVGNEDSEHETPPKARREKKAPDDSRGTTSPQAQAKRERPKAQNGKAADLTPPMPTGAMERQFHALGTTLHGDKWDEERAKMVEAITEQRDTGKVVSSSKELYRAEMQYLIDNMKDRLA